MKIGFIGAGKMGFTLGKHLKLHEESLQGEDGNQLYHIVGYYSRNIKSAIEAARFTDTNYYESLEELVKSCDALILTVPDGMITEIVEVLQSLGNLMENKIICHTSGALSSQVFSGMDSRVYGYSIHPIYAVSSKTESYKKFTECFITIEGDCKYLEWLKALFSDIGHSVKIISPKDKVKYHSGAVFASNLVIGLYKMATDLLEECGFTEEEADMALKPLFRNNAKRLSQTTPNDALTGPVERCDISIVDNHLKVLTDGYEEVYRYLSLKLVDIARKDRVGDYDKITEILMSNE